MTIVLTDKAKGESSAAESIDEIFDKSNFLSVYTNQSFPAILFLMDLQFIYDIIYVSNCKWNGC